MKVEEGDIVIAIPLGRYTDSYYGKVLETNGGIYVRCYNYYHERSLDLYCDVLEVLDEKEAEKYRLAEALK